jgi:hypothetical protein
VAVVVVEVAAVAVTSVEWVECHTAALAAECHAAASLAAEWARAARVGAVLMETGTAEIGMAITAMAETGMATTGIMGIITATM